MKIQAPLDSVKETETLIKAGADELYCGVYNKIWKDLNAFPNARHTYYGNLKSFDEFKKVLSITKKYGIPLYFCVNEYYSQSNYRCILNDIDHALELGVNGFIVADVSLIPLISHKTNKSHKMILSSLNPCFNFNAIKFFKNLGVNRIILPLSQMSLSEITALNRQCTPIGIEIEVFINDTSCKNVNGYCLYHNLGIDTYFDSFYAARMKYALAIGNHITRFLPSSLKDIIGKVLWSSNMQQSHICKKKCTIQVMKIIHGNIIEEGELPNISLENDFAQKYCTVCLLFYLAKHNITFGKIAGRGAFTSKKLKDIRCARRYLNEINNNIITENNYLKKGAIIHKKIYKQDCTNKFCFS